MKVGLFIPCYINAVYPGGGSGLLLSYEKHGGGCRLSAGPDLLRTTDGECRFEEESVEFIETFDRLLNSMITLWPVSPAVVFVRDHLWTAIAKDLSLCQRGVKIYKS